VKKIISTLIIFILLINISCTQSDNNVVKDDIPSWVYNTPVDNDYYYFSGSSKEVKTIKEGEDQALIQIQQKLVTLVGAQVSTSLEQSETYINSDGNEEYTATLNSIINIESSGIVKNLNEEERFVEKKGDKVVVYLLYKISKKTVKEEQIRIEKLYKEQIDSIFVPEENGKKNFAAGEFYMAVKNFLQSAKNANQSVYENKDIIIERNLDNVITILGRFTGELNIPASNNYKGESGSTPIYYKLSYNYNGKVYPVRNAPVKFFLRNLDKNGKEISYEFSGTTDQNGELKLTDYIFPYAGQVPVVAFFDIAGLLRDLDDATSEKFDDKIGIIQDKVKVLKIQKDISVTSRTIGLETVIYQNFTDENGNKIDISASEFSSELTKTGVKLLSENLVSGISPEEIESKDNLAELKKKGVKRVLILSGYVEKTKTYSGKEFVNVVVSIKIVNLNNNKIDILTKKGSGSSEKLLNAIKIGYEKTLSDMIKELSNYL